MDTSDHVIDHVPHQRDWVPALTLAFMFAVQTAIVIWKASELSANQRHIQGDLEKLVVDLREMKDREQKFVELTFHVAELKRRVEKIENDPMP